MILQLSCWSLPPVVVLAVFPSSDANETQSDEEGTVQRAMRSEDPGTHGWARDKDGYLDKDDYRL